MPPTKRIAVAQWHIKDLEIEHNHKKACQYIREAASQGAELVVLPEYHLNGFIPTSPLYATQAASTQSYLTTYQALARELQICLVPGTIVEKHGDRLYNTAYFISTDGSILGSYRKKNIWHPERPYLTSSGPDERHEVLDTPVGKVGLLICWDLSFPEAFRELVVKGAEVIIVPTFWTKHDASPALLAANPDCETLLLESMLTARCFENTCAVIFANAASSDEDSEGKFLGLSGLHVPALGAVGKMGPGEGVLAVDMDLGLVRLAEENYKVRADLGREGWHYGYWF
ncbi:putative hydrolase, carbon-nitrogen family [Aspergillus steynii IBT 23096]|uniref:Putative hydrolase, carbon-nitrogen family n=1 Tax=Aspergillus steynii IBT 23096 TaxID=1392250 RepID=A0A2I2GGS7_9EURO|nr:putative hydrolase, carbon-nitrogen family [Aspergillus steynii IBT 23096]PLB52073.1 putative hydrolase, carbon-nitrogen family [Aspergillus steynii IBT 23096]